jgi:hypothetical protein
VPSALSAIFRAMALGKCLLLSKRSATEDAVRQPDDRVQIAFGEQLFLDGGLHAFAEQSSVRQNDGTSTAVFQQRQNQHQKQIGGFTSSELLREVGLDAVLLHASERWIGDDAVDSILRPVTGQRSGQSIVVPDVGGHVDAVQQHVGDAQQMRQRFFLNAQDRTLKQFFFVRRFDLLSQMIDGTGEKAAGAAGRIQDRFAELRIDHVDHKLRHGSGRVVFARVACTLEVFQDLLVQVAENVPVFGAVEVEAFIDLVDDLPHQCAVLHVLVGVFEDIMDDSMTRTGFRRQSFEAGEQLVVDEVQQAITGESFGVSGPIAPAEFFRDG